MPRVDVPAQSPAPTPRAPRARLLLGAFAVSGAAALVYEVTWTRALSLVIGSTTYALSTMLATFMGGLALGGAVGGRLADRSKNLVAAFAACELGVGLFGVASLPLIYALPRVYLALYQQFHLYPRLFFTVQLLLCAAVMAVPTFLMGATFPIVSRAVARSLAQVGSDVGAAYSLNTVGAVVGSLGAGFLLVPWLGLTGAALVAGGLNLVVGLGLLVVAGRRSKAVLGAVLLGGAGVLAAVSGAESTAPFVNYYSAHRLAVGQPWRELADGDPGLRLLGAFDAAEGRVRAFRAPGEALLLQVGGKVEGTSVEDLENTLLLAYLPAAAHPRPERMLVIGLGAGKTLEAAKRAVPEVDLVEIHPGVVEAVRRFGPAGVLDGVTLFRDDARSFLLKTERRYDVISSEPSYPTEAVVANLFTKEYFELAAQRLAPGGVYAQWLPYHLLTNQGVTMMVRTFASAFPHVYLWRVPRSMDLILVGRREPFSRSEAEIRAGVDALNQPPWPLTYQLSRRPEEVASVVGLEDVPMNTDDRPRLEFELARNLLVGDLALVDEPDERVRTGGSRGGRQE